MNQKNISFQFVINATNEKAIQDAEEELTLALNRLSENFPIDTEKFSQIANEAQTNATESFLNTAINVQKHQVSISSPFNTQLLCAQIPKAQKKPDDLTVFLCFWDLRLPKLLVKCR